MHRRLSVAYIVKSEDLDGFDDEFESLLDHHERDRKSKQFHKERMSITSISQKPTNANKVSKLKPLKSKNKVNSFDDLEGIQKRLKTLQNILKYLPDEQQVMSSLALTGQDVSGIFDEDIKNDSETDMEPSCSGFLVIVGGGISEATRFYCELIKHVLYLKRNPNGRIKQVITISFIQYSSLQKDSASDEEQKVCLYLYL